MLRVAEHMGRLASEDHASNPELPRLAASVCQLRHDQMEQSPTEPPAGLLSSGGAGRVLLSGLWCGAGLLLRTNIPTGR